MMYSKKLRLKDERRSGKDRRALASDAGGFREGVEAAAKIADAHKGSAAREITATRWKLMDEETREEIRAEQRGEDIASEVIAGAIRALLTNAAPQKE